VAHGLQKKPLDFGGNQNHVTLGHDYDGVTRHTREDYVMTVDRVTPGNTGHVLPGAC